MNSTGISPDRVHMFYCSSAEGQRFQEEVTRISNIIESLGKNSLRRKVASNKKDKTASSNEKTKTE